MMASAPVNREERNQPLNMMIILTVNNHFPVDKLTNPFLLSNCESENYVIPLPSQVGGIFNGTAVTATFLAMIEIDNVMK